MTLNLASTAFDWLNRVAMFFAWRLVPRVLPPVIARQLLVRYWPDVVPESSPQFLTVDTSYRSAVGPLTVVHVWDGFFRNLETIGLEDAAALYLMLCLAEAEVPESLWDAHEDHEMSQLHSSVTIQILEDRIKVLEDENRQLKAASTHALTTDAEVRHADSLGSQLL